MSKVFKDYSISSEKETAQLAHSFSKILKPADVLCLEGNLGAGKTTFARFLIRKIMKDQSLQVPSPTFTLVQTYQASYFSIWHFDLYRLKNPEEILELGFEEALEKGISLIEWPEILGPYTPQRYIMLKFIEEDQRKVQLKTYGNWGDQLDCL